MLISCICATGSTEINSHLRAELLWRMVNSMHDDPGHDFELILVDNCHGPGSHREAIDQIFATWRTVTHVVRNRRNEYHGGGVNQGVALSDGELLIQITDDLEWAPGWLGDLVAPLLAAGPPGPPEGLSVDPRRIIAAPMKGHNASGRRLGSLMLDRRKYQIRSNAAAYCWAFWRETWDEIGKWRRAHFADTRWSRHCQRKGYRFVLPTWPIAKETNTNYLRPWDYHNERKFDARSLKVQRLADLFETGAFLERDPERPDTKWPLKNPKGIGPGKYPLEWLREQGVPGA